MKNNFFFNTDEFFLDNYCLSKLVVNDYPILMVAWNLFLFLIPFFLFLLLKKLYLKSGFKKIYEKVTGLLLFFIWLLFVPNVPYVITDVRHLLNYCPIDSYLNVCTQNAWMIMFFFVYSIFGWIFFVLFLNQMKNLILKIFSKKISQLFIIIVIPSISLGVLLGLLNRFNSWYFFQNPLLIFRSMLMYITDINYFINFVGFTIGLYILYFIGNFLFRRKFKKND